MRRGVDGQRSVGWDMTYHDGGWDEPVGDILGRYARELRSLECEIIEKESDQGGDLNLESRNSGLNLRKWGLAYIKA